MDYQVIMAKKMETAKPILMCFLPLGMALAILVSIHALDTTRTQQQAACKHAVICTILQNTLITDC